MHAILTRRFQGIKDRLVLPGGLNEATSDGFHKDVLSESSYAVPISPSPQWRDNTRGVKELIACERPLAFGESVKSFLQAMTNPARVHIDYIGLYGLAGEPCPAASSSGP